MKIVIIGSGNMAWFLARRLQSPFVVEQIYSPNREHAAALANSLNVPFVCKEDEVLTNADIYILAIKDDVVHKLSQSFRRPNALIMHTAGSISLQDIVSISSHVACIWPMFSIHKNELPSHRQIPLILQSAIKEDLPIVQQMAQLISDELFILDDEQKKWAHLAAVFANNFTNHIVGIGQEILKQHQIPENLILPILRNTIDKLQNQSAFQIQTGPAIRRDLQTLNTHEHMLLDYPAWRNLYEALSQSIQVQHPSI